MSWEEIVETARGGEVNVFMWGGADNINAYVSDYIGGILEEEYDITLNRVPLSEPSQGSLEARAHEVVGPTGLLAQDVAAI